MTHRNATKLPSTNPEADGPGEPYPLLQDDVIHYNGQHVALVVAESFEQATHAANLVTARYAVEPVVARLEDARDKTVMPRHFRGGARPPDSRPGEPDAAFAAAPVHLDLIYTTP